MRATFRGFGRLLRWELFKLYKRPSSYIGFVFCLVFCALVMIGLGWAEVRGRKFMGMAIDRDTFLNGPFYANFVLNLGFYAILPILAATLAGGQLAGEAKDGTLRALLVRPPSRTAVYLAKAAASLVWMQIVIGFLLALALAIGHIAYGGGGMAVYMWEFKSRGLWVVSSHDWPWLMLAVSIGAGASLALVTAFALFLSACTDNPVVANAGALGAFFMSSILQRLPDEVFPAELKTLLPTDRMNFWHELYRWYQPNSAAFDHHRLVSGAVTCGCLTLFFLAAGLVVFVRKDVTS